MHTTLTVSPVQTCETPLADLVLFMRTTFDPEFKYTTELIEGVPAGLIENTSSGWRIRPVAWRSMHDPFTIPRIHSLGVYGWLILSELRPGVKAPKGKMRVTNRWVVHLVEALGAIRDVYPGSPPEAWGDLFKLTPNMLQGPALWVVDQDTYPLMEDMVMAFQDLDPLPDNPHAN
jgi:hypothetical protein